MMSLPALPTDLEFSHEQKKRRRNSGLRSNQRLTRIVPDYPALVRFIVNANHGIV
jgi:hypothetical protein